MSSEMTSTAEEKSEVLALLRSSQQQFLAAIDAIALEFCEQSTAEGRWSVLQCMEHVVNAEEGMSRLWQKMAAPGTGDRTKDELVRQGLSSREVKRKAPERVVPLGKIKTVAEARDRFVAARTATIAMVEQVPAEELRNKIVPHPVTGIADGYQLFHIMALHANRHAEQMTETAQQLAAQRHA